MARPRAAGPGRLQEGLVHRLSQPVLPTRLSSTPLSSSNGTTSRARGSLERRAYYGKCGFDVGQPGARRRRAKRREL